MKRPAERAQTFSGRALAHLGRYKLEELGISEPGFFSHKGTDLEKAHILPVRRRSHNLLPLVRPCFETLTDTRGEKIKWHLYFSHLNSSQALAVNLFQPFLTNAPRQALLTHILQLKTPLIRAGFEHVPDEREGTNVDFYAEDAEGGLLVEVKFTESGFGTARDDAAHQQKYHEIYRPRLKDIAEFGASERAEFFSGYQFFRNALYAGLRRHTLTRVWFLFPHDNAAIRDAAQKCMLRLRHDVAPHVRLVELESLLEEIDTAVSADPELATHFAQFRTKYIVPS